MSDESEIQQNVYTLVISPEDLLHTKPDTVDEGYYVARLADDGVGNPSYAVLRLADSGAFADRVSIDGGVKYEQTAVQDDEVLYRARGGNTASSWAANG
jgi:hypothetical protein